MGMKNVRWRKRLNPGAWLLWLCGCAASAQVFNTNLIINGNAEAGPGAPDGGAVASVPGWTTSGAFTVVQYGAPGGYPVMSDPGPPYRGTNFFAGGPSGSSSGASQVIDVSGGAATIDTGGVRCFLAGYLGGFSSQDDYAVLTASFRNASASVLGSVSIGPVMAADRQSVTGLLYRRATNAVPAGTRSILLQLQMTLAAGTYIDGYADSLALVLLNSNLPPRLNLSATTNLATLNWPASAADWQLESTTNLPGGWTNSPVLTEIIGNSVLAPTSDAAGRQFFRLRKP
jgi:hypothetical protein